MSDQANLKLRKSTALSNHQPTTGAAQPTAGTTQPTADTVMRPSRIMSVVLENAGLCRILSQLLQNTDLRALWPCSQRVRSLVIPELVPRQTNRSLAGLQFLAGAGSKFAPLVAHVSLSSHDITDASIVLLQSPFEGC